MVRKVRFCLTRYQKGVFFYLSVSSSIFQSYERTLFGAFKRIVFIHEIHFSFVVFEKMYKTETLRNKVFICRTVKML